MKGRGKRKERNLSGLHAEEGSELVESDGGVDVGGGEEVVLAHGLVEDGDTLGLLGTLVILEAALEGLDFLGGGERRTRDERIEVGRVLSNRATRKHKRRGRGRPRA